MTGNTSELYGENRFASIVVSADDTEPPVLRCFLGLPPHVVKESDALALAAKTGGAAWRVRHCLMLGLFDEAFSLETTTGSTALVVEMRTRSSTSLADAKARALAKRVADPDPERVRKCQEAWNLYREAVEHVPAPAKVPTAGAGVRKTNVAAALKDAPSRTDGNGQ